MYHNKGWLVHSDMPISLVQLSENVVKAQGLKFEVVCTSEAGQTNMLSGKPPKLFQFLNCVQVWYNPEGYHSLPAYLNSLNNFILRANLPKNETSRYGKCPFT